MPKLIDTDTIGGGAGKTIGDTTGSVGKTASGTAKGVGKTVGDTTGALSKGDMSGVVSRKFDQN